MSTETQSETEAKSVSSHIQSQHSVFEPIAITALMVSLLVHYALAFVVLNETIGSAFATAPVWFNVGLNTALALPIMLSMILFAAYVISIFDHKSPDYWAAVVYGTPCAIIGVQPLFWAAELGVF